MSACSDYAKQNVAKMMQSDTLIYTQEADNVTINYTDSGALKARITAKKLLGFKRDGNDIVKITRRIPTISSAPEDDVAFNRCDNPVRLILVDAGRLRQCHRAAGGNRAQRIG